MPRFTISDENNNTTEYLTPIQGDNRYFNTDRVEKLQNDLDMNDKRILNPSEDSDIITKSEAVKLESKITKSLDEKLNENKLLIQANQKNIQDSFDTIRRNKANVDLTNIWMDEFNKKVLAVPGISNINQISDKIDKTEVIRDYVTKASFILSESTILGNQIETNKLVNSYTGSVDNYASKTDINTMETEVNKKLSNKINKNVEINMSLNKIINLKTPTSDSDAVNKQYVEQMFLSKSIIKLYTGTLFKNASYQKILTWNLNTIIPIKFLIEKTAGQWFEINSTDIISQAIYFTDTTEKLQNIRMYLDYRQNGLFFRCPSIIPSDWTGNFKFYCLTLANINVTTVIPSIIPDSQIKKVQGAYGLHGGVSTEDKLVQLDESVYNRLINNSK